MLRREIRKRSWWVSVGVLAFSLSALVTAWSVYQLAVRRPLPVDIDRVVSLGGLAFGQGIPDPLVWWNRAAGIEQLAYFDTGDAELLDGRTSQWVRVSIVTGNFFAVFDNPIDMGQPTDNWRSPAQPTAVVDASLWRLCSNGRSIADNVRVRVGGLDVLVVGVVRDGFGFPSATRIWVSGSFVERQRPNMIDGVAGLPPRMNKIGWIAKLGDGVSEATAREQLLVLLSEANRVLTPRSGLRFGDVIGIAPLRRILVGSVGPAIALLLAAAAVVFVLCLLSAWAALFLDGYRRTPAMAMRICCGASRTDVLRLEFSRCLLMCAAVLITAIPVTAGLLHTSREILFTYRTYLPDGVGTIATAAPILLGLGAVTLLCLSSTSVYWAYRDDLLSVLKSGLRGASFGDSRWLRRIGLGFSAAVATAMLAGMIVADRNLATLLRADLGYEPARVAAVFVSFQRAEIAKRGFTQLRQEILSELRALPYDHTAIVGSWPMTEGQRNFVQVGTADHSLMAAVIRLDGSMFQTLGLTERGTPYAGQSGFVAVSESLARELWPSGSAIGQQLMLGEQTEVVSSVVSDVRTVDQTQGSVPQVYLPFPDLDPAANPASTFGIQVWARCVQCPPFSVLVDRLRLIEGAQVTRVERLSDALDRVRSGPNAAATLWSMFAGLTVLIAFYSAAGHAASTVEERHVEIGIRAAVGASPRWIVGWLIFESALYSVVGAAMGVATCYGAARLIQARAPGVALPATPVACLAAVSVVALCLAASLVRAYSAAKESPVFLLRGDG